MKKPYKSKWQEKQENIQLELDTQAKTPFFNNFEEYLKQYPNAQSWQRMVNNGILIATYPDQSCLDGDYYIVKITPDSRIIVNDGDDGYMIKHCNNIKEANEELEMLKQLAPFHYSALKDFGYENG